ncbi:MAG: hypothetical protein U0835_11780 [Isosphaeraceae bacterium]
MTGDRLVRLCERLDRLGVAPGSAFGLGGEGHVRICFAVDESTLREALDRFEAGWRCYRERLSPVARGAS